MVTVEVNIENNNNTATNNLILSRNDFLLLKKQDTGIITKIFKELKNDIYNFIYLRTGRNIDEANEIFSDSTESFLKYLPKIKYNKSIKSLWIKITCGKISDYYKQKERQIKIINNVKKDLAINNQDAAFDIDEAYFIYDTAMKAINKKYRKIILLRYKENRSLDEICGILNAGNKKSVKNTLFSAKTALKKEMNNFKRKCEI